jgi:DNA-binding transcriptional ArsR family regulator
MPCLLQFDCADIDVDLLLLYFPRVELSVKSKYDDKQVGAIFAALADPTRRKIVERLRDGSATVSDLAVALSVGAPSVSKHLTVLQDVGLISRHHEAQWRRCQLEAEAFLQLNEWLEHYTNLWVGGLERLDQHLAALEGE